ncbi:MAG: hypothetical protein IJR51_03465, partial [Clostridia bacterium]|nr:hypothetical protein [Clostridia bacterium]
KIDALGHDYVDHDGQAATCLEDGWKPYQTCTRCDYTSYEKIDALGHDYVDHDGQAATCLEDGWKPYQTCTRCDYSSYEVIPARGHDWSEWTETAAPTCLDVGRKERTCSRCGGTDTAEIAALGHMWSAWATVTEPSPEADGLEKRVCYRCNAEETHPILWNAEADRTVQFVVSGDMHYVLHTGDTQYEIYRGDTPAIMWYSTRPLSFSVVLHGNWSANGCIVSVNGKELKPNADGTYTLPAGTDYAIVNCDPVTVAEDGSISNVCAYCGKIHPNSIWGRIVAFFHLIFHFFNRLFGR